MAGWSRVLGGCIDGRHCCRGRTAWSAAASYTVMDGRGGSIAMGRERQGPWRPEMRQVHSTRRDRGAGLSRRATRLLQAGVRGTMIGGGMLATHDSGIASHASNQSVFPIL